MIDQLLVLNDLFWRIIVCRWLPGRPGVCWACWRASTPTEDCSLVTTTGALCDDSLGCCAVSTQGAIQLWVLADIQTDMFLVGCLAVSTHVRTSGYRPFPKLAHFYFPLTSHSTRQGIMSRIFPGPQNWSLKVDFLIQYLSARKEM